VGAAAEIALNNATAAHYLVSRIVNALSTGPRFIFNNALAAFPRITGSRVIAPPMHKVATFKNNRLEIFVAGPEVALY
jgi:hypothetical protein